MPIPRTSNPKRSYRGIADSIYQCNPDRLLELPCPPPPDPLLLPISFTSLPLTTSSTSSTSSASFAIAIARVPVIVIIAKAMQFSAHCHLAISSPFQMVFPSISAIDMTSSALPSSCLASVGRTTRQILAASRSSRTLWENAGYGQENRRRRPQG